MSRVEVGARRPGRWPAHVGGFGLVLACGGPAPAEPVDGGPSSDPPARRRALGGGEWDGRWLFRGGIELGGVQVDPHPAVAGAPLTIEFGVAGTRPDCELAVGLLPPRAQARQLVRVGENEVGRDPRTAWTTITLRDGTQRVELVLAESWHPRTVVIAAELVCDGEAIPVEQGARAELGLGAITHDGRPGSGWPGRTGGGRAIVALVPVVPQATHVVAPRVEGIVLDGELDEPAWSHDPGVLVESLEGEPVPGEPTRVWFVWSDVGLHWAGDLPDADLWSDYTAHDEPLYNQEAFELFLAGDDSATAYLEYQVSARGVTFDASFTGHRLGDERWNSGWKTAVSRSGTVNDRRDRDRGWTVEATIPWSEICEKTAVSCPPRAGTKLRVNVFRLERPDRKRAVGYALSPTRSPDFHAWSESGVLELRP